MQGTIDSGSTAWMLASSAMVLLMVPGLVLFYGGMGKIFGLNWRFRGSA